MKLPVADGSFDAAYEIEATCHAPDIRGVYGEIFRALKPGGVFASYEWALTEKYSEHNKVCTIPTYSYLLLRNRTWPSGIVRGRTQSYVVVRCPCF